MSKIRVLPDHISNLIAAGEVVERPASVAKELVENAIDAGATRIVIDVESGGRRLLKITDDGEGMTRDDAVLAFERHATSKISKAEDLNAISTLGFRGEALASIASVAKVELVSNTADAAAGTRVVIEGGRLRDVKDAAHPRGTTIAVRDLFFNTPARRKFLRSEATESYHLTNLATHYALAHPEIAFTLTNNGRETLRVAPAQDLRERAYQVFGAQFLDGLLEVDNRNADSAKAFPAQIARVQGFVSAPRERRTSRDAQFLFVNGRFVRDRLIGRALSEGYRSILPHGVYPKQVAWALHGTAGGTTYEYDAILEVAGGPAPSPFAQSFDPTHLPRIQAIESELRHWLAHFDQNPGERFVSDGDAATVTIPAGTHGRLRPALPPGVKVVERD